MAKQEELLWGHPKGLYILFFTELWERFSYYGMRAILILYLTAKTTDSNAGLGWNSVSALQLYGWYTMMVYVMSVPGGLLADRLLGQKKTVMLGGFLLVIGHFVLAFDEIWAFYTGIVLIVLGVGALKPNISTMVGGLYNKGDAKRDTAFTIFYIGINIGAFAAPIIVGYLGEVINWHYGFGLAGIGMAIGQIVYIWGQKYLTEVGNFVPVKTAIGTNKKVGLTAIEKDRMIVLILSFIIVIVFWGAYEQAGGLMNLYARDKIDRVFFGFTIPTSFLQSLHAFYVILIGLPVAYLWTQWRKKGKESSSLFKMGIGTIITGLGFLLLARAAIETTVSLDGKASIYWLFGAYLLHVIGELSISPVALSFITKLAPVKYASLMMGAYFMVSGLGNKLAGALGEAAQSAGEYTIFMGIFIFCALFGLVLIVFVKKLKKLTHGADDVKTIPIVEAE
ncbi:peptide MFS transporter [Lutibacter sp.]|uniref:peptide MFS transporter n=1 Tax=Lutibacter sp. TaxID=1925666 RepID=UPI0025BF5C0D|nr:peptide MFS transporter [Lutibacter sp.]MCF6169160.1 peptide MFS transporter [Lutibacter sp.]